MSATSRQRLIKGLRWAARVIGFGATAVFFFVGFSARVFSEGMDSTAIFRFSMVTVFIALVGCFVSWWQGWLAGVLLIISWLTVILGITFVFYYDYQNAVLADLVLSSPLLAAGVLFLLSWWISKKTSPPALPPSPKP